MGRPVVYFEIAGRDRPRAEAFYSQLFDWELTPAGMASRVTPGPGGIGGHIVSYGHAPENQTMFYVGVDDLQATLDKAEALGGRTMIPPTEIPENRGSFAWFLDLDGNIIGLYRNP
jgi:uncharacterized protein